MSPVGRPKAEKPKANRFSIRLDDETEQKLEKYCEEHQITKGEAIRQGIHLLLAKNRVVAIPSKTINYSPTPKEVIIYFNIFSWENQSKGEENHGKIFRNRI